MRGILAKICKARNGNVQLGTSLELQGESAGFSVVEKIEFVFPVGADKFLVGDSALPSEFPFVDTRIDACEFWVVCYVDGCSEVEAGYSGFG